MQTTYPVVEVAQSCTASRKAVPARTNTRPEAFGVVSPVMFAMELPDSDDLRISADKKAMIAKKDGWTWTMTPTIAAQVGARGDRRSMTAVAVSTGLATLRESRCECGRARPACRW